MIKRSNFDKKLIKLKIESWFWGKNVKIIYAYIKIGKITINQKFIKKAIENIKIICE